MEVRIISEETISNLQCKILLLAKAFPCLQIVTFSVNIYTATWYYSKEKSIKFARNKCDRYLSANEYCHYMGTDPDKQSLILIF